MRQHKNIFIAICITVLLLVIALPLLLANSYNNEIADDTCDLPDSLLKEIRSYEDVANKIISTLTNGKHKGGTYNELAKFIDKFGARVAGSRNLEKSIDYMLELLANYDLENIHGEEVQIEHWIRSVETAEILEPRTGKLKILGLGSSIGTSPDGIEAEAIVVNTFEQLTWENVSKNIEGKIVVFNQDWAGYGATAQYRTKAASEASKFGAVATLVRSVTPYSLSTLHTGQQFYSSNITKIPTACITVEDARMLQRCQDRGDKIVIKIYMNDTNYPDTTSRNTVAEIKGQTLPEKTVLVSGHLDSWDVGVGAMDDGGGAFISWYALAVLKSLGLRPKRTLRAVLWTAEEQGTVGWSAYNATHFHELDNFTFVMESDEGTFTPRGITYAAGFTGGCIIQEIVKLLEPINATQTEFSQGVSSDIFPWTVAQIPGASLLNANEKYFWFHHSDADTMDVLNPDDLDKATAVWAVVSYIIADLQDEFPRDRDTVLSSKYSIKDPVVKLIEKRLNML